MKTNHEKKLKGAKASPGNQERYNVEIAKMKAVGEKFSINQFGKVNVAAFAARCQFSRSVIESGSLAGRFAADVDKIGLATAHDLVRRDTTTDGNHKITRDLPKQLQFSEVEALRKKVEELTKQVRELQVSLAERDRSLEHMLITGERFFL